MGLSLTSYIILADVYEMIKIRLDLCLEKLYPVGGWVGGEGWVGVGVGGSS